MQACTPPPHRFVPLFISYIHTSTHPHILFQVMVDEGQQEDPLELPIPEQFISSFQGGKLITVAASHSGA